LAVTLKTGVRDPIPSGVEGEFVRIPIPPVVDMKLGFIDVGIEGDTEFAVMLRPGIRDPIPSGLEGKFVRIEVIIGRIKF